MKKRVSRWLALIALIMLSSMEAMAYQYGSAKSVTIDDVTYYVRFCEEDLVCHIASFGSNVTVSELTIPSTITYNEKDYRVVALGGQYHGYTLETVEKVTLPTQLESLSNYILNRMPNIKEVDIPSTVTELTNSPFAYEHKNLTVTFHSPTPPEVNTYLCEGNTKQLRLVVPHENFRAYSQKDYYEDQCVIADNWQDEDAYGTVRTGKVDDGELGHIVVQDRLPDILVYSDVNKLIVEQGTINADDFYQIRQMTNLVYLDLSGLSIEEIPTKALQDCWQIQTIILPPTLKRIRSYAFSNTGCEEIVLPDGLEEVSGGNNFARCERMTDLHFPSGVKSLPDNVAYDCPKLQRLTLPKYIEELGSSAFMKCDIRELIIPGTLKEVSSQSFESNTNMANVVLGDGIQTIANYAFRCCESLIRVTMPPSMRTLGIESFAACTSLVVLNLNEGLEEIKRAAFYGCKKLPMVTLPSSLLYCREAPFAQCTNLDSITCYALIPPTVKNVVPTQNAQNIKLAVPLWSFQEYMTTPGWLEYQDHTSITEHMPDNIYITKDFEFVLRDAMIDKEYRPNLRMMWNEDDIDDGFGHIKRERGNLTMSSNSGQIRLKDFSMYFSPYAKYYADRSMFEYGNGYNYDYYRTNYNGNALVIRNEKALSADDIAVTMMARNDLWQFITLPFNVRVGDIQPLDEKTQWVVRCYDAQARASHDFDNTWVNLTADSIMKAGKGYILRCYNSDNNSNSNPVEFVFRPVNDGDRNRIFTNGDLQTQLLNARDTQYPDNNEINEDWNLVGNQFPSFFDTRFMDTWQTFLVWDSFNKTYAAFRPGDDCYILSPGEAFFIQMPTQVDDPTTMNKGMLNFRKNGRQIYRNPNDIIDANVKAEMPSASERRLYNLTLTDGTMTDRTRVVFSSAASLRYERGMDAPKFMSMDATVPQLWTMGGTTRYSINERPMGDGLVKLGMRLEAPGTYTIQVGEGTAADELYIIDKVMGTTSPIQQGQGYTFYAEAGTDTDRFTLMVKTTGTTAVETIETTSDNTRTYDLSGKPATDGQKGIVVKDGKKVVK